MEDVMCLALTSSTWQARTRSLLSLGEIANWLTREQLYITPESWDDLGEDDDTDGWYEDHKELYENAKGCGRNLKKVLAPLGAIGMELEALRMMTLPMENGVHGRHVYPCFHTKRSLFFLSYHQTAVHYAGPIGRYSSLDRHMSSGAGTTYLMDAKSASLMGARVAKLGLAHEDVYAIFKTCSSQLTQCPHLPLYLCTLLTAGVPCTACGTGAHTMIWAIMSMTTTSIPRMRTKRTKIKMACCSMS